MTHFVVPGGDCCLRSKGYEHELLCRSYYQGKTLCLTLAISSAAVADFLVLLGADEDVGVDEIE